MHIGINCGVCAFCRVQGGAYLDGSLGGLGGLGCTGQLCGYLWVWHEAGPGGAGQHGQGTPLPPSCCTVFAQS